jgi:hypothetical protein
MEQLDERRPSVPLRVKAPTSSIVAVWRAPLWQRILFPAVGLAMIAGAFWPEAGKSYEPLWVGVEVVVGAMLVLYALRPKLTLFEDAVYIRGQFLSRLISIEEIAAVEGGYGGLGIWWGDGHFSEASSIGEQTNIDGLPGSDRRRHAIRTLILTTATRTWSDMTWSHPPDPHEEDDGRRSEFKERGWGSTTLHPPENPIARTATDVRSCLICRVGRAPACAGVGSGAAISSVLGCYFGGPKSPAVC